MVGQRLYHVIQQRDKTTTELVRYKRLELAIRLLLEYAQRVDGLFIDSAIFVSENK